MDSVNVPVPGRVAALANELRPALAPFDTVRERHTLVVKRLGGPTSPDAEKRVRRALAGTPPFEARVAGVGAFEDPAAGRGPVVYLRVRSPGLVDLHWRLCRHVDPAPGIEGEDYVPHVTLARGGGTDARRAIARLIESGVEPVTWTVSALILWDAAHGEVVGRVSLPA